MRKSKRVESWMLASLLLALLTLPACSDDSDEDRILNACTNLCEKAASCADIQAEESIDCVAFCRQEEMVQELSNQLNNAPKQCVDSAIQQLECLAGLECSEFLGGEDDYCVAEAALAEKHCEGVYSDENSNNLEPAELRKTEYYLACHAECETWERCYGEGSATSLPPATDSCDEECLEDAQEASNYATMGPDYQTCLQKENELSLCLAAQSCDEYVDETLPEACLSIDDEADAACDSLDWW